MTVKPLNLEISAETLNQGEQAILQEIAIQLYATPVINFSAINRLDVLSVPLFSQSYFLTIQRINHLKFHNVFYH